MSWGSSGIEGSEERDEEAEEGRELKGELEGEEAVALELEGGEKSE